MKFSVVLTLEVYNVEQDCAVSGDWTPGRKPPPCQDHDHPAFGDPGNPPEIKIHEVRDENGRLVPDAVWEGLIDEDDLLVQLAEARKDRADAAREDADDKRREQGWD